MRRRPVAGYLLASILVGVIGMVAAIVMTVSGIMNPFRDVSQSYEDIAQTGVEIGTQATELQLQNAKYTIMSFSKNPETPGAAVQMQACAVTNEYGDPVVRNTSTQRITSDDLQATGIEQPGVQHAIFTHFESRGGIYTIQCQDPGLLSDGVSQRIHTSTNPGVFTGLASMLIAGGLFVMGIINSSRNKKAQAQRLKRTGHTPDPL